MVLDAAAATAVVVAGALIGATGIGGVLLVPVLATLAGLPVPQAIAASALAFAFPGIAALAWLRNSGAWQWRWMALLGPAIPAAAAGALLVHVVPVRALLAGVAALALASGWRGLRPSPAATPAEPLSTLGLTSLGMGVGLGSGLTGTGGPVLLVPALMLLRQPLGTTVALAQAIQLPLALCAGAFHAGAGALDLGLALVLGVLLLAGSLAGRAAAARLPLRHLQTLVSLLLLAVGALFAWRALAA